MKTRRIVGCALLGLVALAAGCTEQLDVGSTDSSTIAVTESGRVVGSRLVGNASEKFFLEHGVVSSFDPPGIDVITAVNNNDLTVGMAFQSGSGTSGSYRPAKFAPGHVSTTLRLPAGYDAGEAWDVDDAGRVVGKISAPRPVDPYRAVLWAADGTPTILPLPAGVDSAGASGMNEVGDIVGTGYGFRPGHSTDRIEMPVIWVGAAHEARVLALPGDTRDGSAQAIDLNDAGQTIGLYSGNDGGVHAVTWVSPSSPALRLPGGRMSGAGAINNRGTIVGWVDDAASVQQAAQWLDGGRTAPELLSDRAESPATAMDVSDRGEVVGDIVVNNHMVAARWHAVKG